MHAIAAPPDFAELDDAINIARSRNMNVSLVKALTVKARATSSTDPTAAKLIAEEALRLALDSEYVPGRVFAEICLADIESRLGETYNSELHAAHAQQVREHLLREFDAAVQSDRSLDLPEALKRLESNPHFLVRS